MVYITNKHSHTSTEVYLLSSSSLPGFGIVDWRALDSVLLRSSTAECFWVEGGAEHGLPASDDDSLPMITW